MQLLFVGMLKDKFLWTILVLFIDFNSAPHNPALQEHKSKNKSLAICNFTVHVLILRLYLELCGPYWARQAIIIASEDPKMSQQDTAGRRKHMAVTIPQKL
jgi:hypothetical protein